MTNIWNHTFQFNTFDWQLSFIFILNLHLRLHRLLDIFFLSSRVRFSRGASMLSRLLWRDINGGEEEKNELRDSETLHKSEERSPLQWPLGLHHHRGQRSHSFTVKHTLLYCYYFYFFSKSRQPTVYQFKPEVGWGSNCGPQAPCGPGLVVLGSLANRFLNHFFFFFLEWPLATVSWTTGYLLITFKLRDL